MFIFSLRILFLKTRSFFLLQIPPEFNEIHHEDDDLDVSYANDQDTNVRPPTRQPVKRRREYCDVSFPQSTSLFDNFSEDSSAGVRNEFEIFGQGVAVQLNCMPLVEALQAQLEIQELLTRKRLRLCREARTNKTVPVEVPTEVETLPNPAIIKAEPPPLTLIRHQT